MRPAFILLAITAFAVARPLEANANPALTALNDLKAKGQVDALFENAFQEWLSEQDDTVFLKKLMPSGGGIVSKDKYKKSPLAAALARIKMDKLVKGGGGDAPADPPANDPPAERGLDAFDEAMDRAVQEWMEKQTDVSIASLVHPLQARNIDAAKLAAFNELKQNGQLDALIEQAFQEWAAEQDGRILDKIKQKGKEVWDKHIKPKVGEVLHTAVDKGAAFLKGKIDKHLGPAAAPAASEEPAPDAAPEERGLNVLDEAVEQAIQEWYDRQDDASIAALMDGAMRMKSLNKLD
ncbi:hypothetical protein ONZ45_g8434 [Pleurotus djamor]|nr:hypothetical protein ONZ45_g8434 [Pleurotus djamor]